VGDLPTKIPLQSGRGEFIWRKEINNPKKGEGRPYDNPFWGFEQWYVPEGYIPVHASYIS
jgi:hypothetical protein